MNDMLLAVAIAVSPARAARIEIDHVPNRISYRIALTPRELERRASLRVETRDPRTLTQIVNAIERTGTREDAQRADLRYAIRLRDARGVTRATIYLDAFGMRGLVDGRPVRFSSDAIKRAVVSAFPALAN